MGSTQVHRCTLSPGTLLCIPGSVSAVEARAPGFPVASRDHFLDHTHDAWVSQAPIKRTASQCLHRRVRQLSRGELSTAHPCNAHCARLSELSLRLCPTPPHHASETFLPCACLTLRSSPPLPCRSARMCERMSELEKEAAEGMAPRKMRAPGLPSQHSSGLLPTTQARIRLLAC